MKNELNYRIYYILILALLIRLLGISTLNLGEWDEQFHALVAKNFISNPWIPELVSDHLVYLDPNDWSLCHTWLSKPPLSFWFMALSMKMFGVNEFALRMPSLLFSLATIYLAYLIAKKLFNERIGLLTCFFYAINGLLFEINVGQLSGDHVDTLFHLLFHLSVYVVLFHADKPVYKLGMTLGAFIGLAFLTKWIMAFFIFLVCISYYAYVHQNFKELVKLILYISLTVSIVISPWLFWIYYAFPTETNLIMKGVISPVSQVIQGHTGPWYYYLNSIRVNINELIYIPLLFILYKSFKNLTTQRFLILVWIFIPLILLSISSTKRQVYMMMSATPFFILISLFITYLNQFRIKYKTGVYIFQALIFMAAIRYSIERIKPWKPRLEKPEYRKEMEVLIKNSDLQPDSTVLVNEPHFAEARFYYGLLGYRYLNDSTINSIRNRGYKVFNNVNGKYVKIE